MIAKKFIEQLFQQLKYYDEINNDEKIYFNSLKEKYFMKKFDKN